MIAHPADPHWAPGGIARFVPGDGGIEIAALVRYLPQRSLRRAIGRKVGPVESAGLTDRARTRRIVQHINLEQPAAVLRTFHRQLDQQRTFPDPAGRAGPGDFRHFVPVLQIARRIDQRPVLVRKHHDHDPALRRGVPEYVRIPEIRHVQIEHRIAGVECKAAAAIVAKGQRLALPLRAMARCGGIDCHHRIRPKARTVRSVDHGGPGKDHVCTGLGNRHRQFGPRGQIGADGVTPTHMAPALTFRVVLVKQMPFAGVVDQPVGIAQPVGCGGIVILRSHSRFLKCEGQAKLTRSPSKVRRNTGAGVPPNCWRSSSG